MADQVEIPSYIPWDVTFYTQNVSAAVVGASTAFIFFGITLVQFIHVYKLLQDRALSFSSKQWWIITVLFFLNFADTIVKYFAIVSYLKSVALEGMALYLKKPPQALIPIAPIQGVITAYVQGLYFYRIIRLTRGMPKFNSFQRRAKVITYTLLCVATLLVFTSVGGFTYYAIILNGPLVNYFPRLYVAGGLCLGSSSIVDIILCLLMVYHLYQHKTKALHKTRSIATRLIILTFETGLAPTVGQIIELTFLVTTPKAGYWTAMGFIMSKIYVVAALALYETFLSESSSSAGNTSGASGSQPKGIPSANQRLGRVAGGILVTEVSMQQEEEVPTDQRFVKLQHIRSKDYSIDRQKTEDDK